MELVGPCPPGLGLAFCFLLLLGASMVGLDQAESMGSNRASLVWLVCPGGSRNQVAEEITFSSSLSASRVGVGVQVKTETETETATATATATATSRLRQQQQQKR